MYTLGIQNPPSFEWSFVDTEIISTESKGSITTKIGRVNLCTEDDAASCTAEIYRKVFDCPSVISEVPEGRAQACFEAFFTHPEVSKELTPSLKRVVALKSGNLPLSDESYAHPTMQVVKIELVYQGVALSSCVSYFKDERAYFASVVKDRKEGRFKHLGSMMLELSMRETCLRGCSELFSLARGEFEIYFNLKAGFEPEVNNIIPRASVLNERNALATLNSVKRESVVDLASVVKQIAFAQLKQASRRDAELFLQKLAIADSSIEGLEAERKELLIRQMAEGISSEEITPVLYLQMPFSVIQMWNARIR